MNSLLRVFLLLALLFSGTIFAQEEDDLTGFERAVYYDFIDMEGRKWDEMGDELTEADVYDIYRIIADKHGISLNESMDIVHKGYMTYLNAWEWSVVGELDDRLEVLPENASQYEENQVWYDVADKYGISVYVLDELYEKSWDEVFGW